MDVEPLVGFEPLVLDPVVVVPEDAAAGEVLVVDPADEESPLVVAGAFDDSLDVVELPDEPRDALRLPSARASVR